MISASFSSVLGIQCAGLVGALILHGFFLAVARGRQQHWLFCYLTVIFSAAAILTLQALAVIPALRETVSSIIAVLACIQIGRSRGRRPFAFPKPSVLSAIVGLVLLFDLLWAAFPSYRYDQWNYHLLVGKIIDLQGSLRPPILDDHTYFTGSYDYLFGLPRLISKDDSFVQAFANGFSWLFYVILAWGCVDLAQKKLHWEAPPKVFGAALMLFAMPHYEELINAKANIGLMLVALVLLIALCACLQGENGEKRSWSFWVGFLFIAPLAFKLTWILFAFSLAAALLICLRWQSMWSRFAWRFVALGGLSGGCLCLPFLLKNLFFFGNPLHPVQFAFFKSTDHWLPSNAYHWLIDSGRIGHSYFEILVLVPLAFLNLIKWWLPAIILTLWLRRREHRADLPVTGGLCILTLFIYALLWPKFFNPWTQDRYAEPLFATAVIWVLQIPLQSKTKRLSRLLRFCWLLPVFFNSSVEVKARKMWHGWQAGSVAEFYATSPPPMDIFTMSEAMNVHRKKYFPGAKMRDAIVLTDTPMSYFFDALRLRVASSDYEYFWQKYGETAGVPCVWGFLQQMHIAYLVSYEMPFERWPDSYRDVIASAQLLENAPGEARLRFLSPGLITHKVRSLSECKKF